MAQLEEASDAEEVTKPKGAPASTKGSVKAGKDTSVEMIDDSTHEQDERGDDDDAEDGDEEEYEIETILKAEKGRFDKGEMGYFVSWKGYGKEHNCWVSQTDASNAQDLIDEFWKKKGEKKKKNTVDARPTARGRKPSGVDDASDVGSIKKRGRKPKAIEADAGGDGMDIDEPARKKRRDLATSASTTSHSARPRPSLDDATADDELPVGDMKKWMTIKSWEHIVSVIDTVERHEDGGLEVYFRLNTGEKVKERSELCAERFPQKLIKFYESNLRWKTTEGPDESFET